MGKEGKSMRVFIVYCHPSKESFTAKVLEQFIRGLKLAGHTYEISDLYQMGFQSDYTEEEYLRDAFYKTDEGVSADVKAEQKKILGCDVIVFIYPVFWTEAPAKLVGWFDRVWTHGFAYGEKQTMHTLEKALFMVTCGKTLEQLQETQETQAMATVMLSDRINYRAKEKNMVLFHGMSRAMEEQRKGNVVSYLDKAFQLGVEL